jgi:hypothetical protein
LPRDGKPTKSRESLWERNQTWFPKPLSVSTFFTSRSLDWVFCLHFSSIFTTYSSVFTSLLFSFLCDLHRTNRITEFGLQNLL